MKKTMMKLLSVVMALMMLFGSFSVLTYAVPHEHDKTTKGETVAPRCNAYGYTLYTCSCGETWATDIVAKTEGTHSDAIGKTVDVPAKAPTCEEDGMSAGKACIWCGTILEGGEKTGDKLGHQEKWVLVAEDCNEPERIVFKCINEGCDKEDASSAIYLDDETTNGHDFKYVITKDPKCTLVPSILGTLERVADGRLVTGYTLETANGEAKYECADCGITYTGIVVEWHSHSFAKRDNGKQDDCYNFRSTWEECLECGLVKTNSYTYVDVIKHDFSVAGNVAATCYSEGHEKCGREGCGYEATLPKLDHKMDRVTTPATCLSYGTVYCSNLGCTHFEYINPLDHVMGTVSNGDVAATCHSAGKDYCANGCGYFLNTAANESLHNRQYVCPACTGVCTDCTHAGREYKCQNTGCTVTAPAVSTEHAYSAQKYYTYYRSGLEVTGLYDGTIKFCDDVNLFVYCTNAGCECGKAEGHITGDPVNGTHINLVFVDETEYIAPTCTDDGYVMLNCTECLQGHIKLVGQAAVDFFKAEITRLTAAKADTSLAAAVVTDIDTLIARYNTFVDNTLANYRPLLALGHNSEADATKVVGPNDEVDREATCSLEGYKQKLICGRSGCQHVIKEAQVLPKVGGKDGVHKTAAGADAFSVIATYAATCSTPEITYKKCSECGYVAYEPDDSAFKFNKFNHVKYVIGSDYKLIRTETDIFTNVAAVAVECGKKDGNIAYKVCNECHEVVSIGEGSDLQTEVDTNNNGIRDAEKDKEDILFTLADTIIDKAHQFEDVAAKTETCTEDGWEAYKKDCTRCGEASPTTKKVIYAHGEKFAVTIDPADAYAPECTKPGVAAGRYCAKCATKDYTTSTAAWTYVEEPDLENPTSAYPWYIAGTGHGANQPYMKTLGAVELARVTIVEGECVKTSYGVRYCSYCLDDNYDVLTDILLGRCDDAGKKVASGAWTIINYVEPVYHVYPEAVYETDAAKGIYKNVTENFTAPNFDKCATDKTYSVACKNCDAAKVVKTEAAEGHYYNKGGVKTIISIKCTEIDAHNGVACVECGKRVGTDITAKHDIIRVVEYAGCLPGEEGREFWACKDCEARYFIDDTDPFATPVDPETTGDDPAYVTLVPVTGHDFYKFSTDDKGELLFQAPTLEADGYVARECTKCGTVTTILPKLVPTLNIEVESEKDTVAAGDTFYVELSYAGDFTKFNALQVRLAYDVNKLKFLAEDFDKELPAGVAVKEENNGFVTVTVYSLDGIEPGADGASLKIYFRAKNNFDASEIVAITYAGAFATAGGTPITSDVLKIVKGEPATLTSVITGDINGFAGIDAGDAVVMMDLIYSQQYNAAADMDKDGKITVADFAILSKLIATDGSDEAYKATINAQVTAKNGISYTRIS